MVTLAAFTDVFFIQRIVTPGALFTLGAPPLFVFENKTLLFCVLPMHRISKRPFCYL